MSTYKDLKVGETYIMPKKVYEPDMYNKRNDPLEGKEFILKLKPRATQIAKSDEELQDMLEHYQNISDTPMLILDYINGPKDQMVTLYHFETQDDMIDGTEKVKFQPGADRKTFISFIETSKNPLPQLPENVAYKIGSYLSGKKGTLKNQLRQIKPTKANPGAGNGSGAAQGGKRHKKRQTRRKSLKRSGIQKRKKN
jgi:hypothetical protein